MTVSSTVRTAGPFEGDGVQTAFPFTMRVFTAADILATQTDADGVVATLVLGSDYTVTLNADQRTSPGGTLTLLAALPTGEVLEFTSDIQANQGARLTSAGGFYPGVIEDALDKLTILAQQQSIRASLQALRAPEIGGVPALPSATQRANTQLLFDANGDPYCAAPASGSAADLALSLASTASATKGAGLSGHNFALNYAVGTIGAAINDIELNVSQFPWLAALDGATDDTAAIQACIDFAPNGATISIPGTAKITSQLLASGKTGLTIKGGRTSKLLFTDGAYIGLLFDDTSQHCKIENLRLYGTNTTAPTITLLKATGDSAYLTVRDCGFAYASIAVLCAATYVVKLIGNQYSNCDTYVKAIATEGGTADLLMLGETFGTSTIGSNALVDLQFIYTRMVGCYWETESRTKHALITRDIPGNPELHYTIAGGQMFQSGSIYVDGQSNLVMTGVTTQRCYHSTNNYFIRVAKEATATLTGNFIGTNTVTAGQYAISGSGHCTVTGNTIRGYDTGAGFQAGICDANTFVDCTTGVSTGFGSTAVVGNTNSFINCTTDIANSSATAVAPGHVTVTLTGCATSPTGTARYEVDNGIVHLYIPAISATSNATAMTLTGLPAAITPDVASFGSLAAITDNGAAAVDQCQVSTGGVVTFYKGGSATGFTAAGTKGTRDCVITYRLRNV